MFLISVITYHKKNKINSLIGKFSFSTKEILKVIYIDDRNEIQYRISRDTSVHYNFFLLGIMAFSFSFAWPSLNVASTSHGRYIPTSERCFNHMQP